MTTDDSTTPRKIRISMSSSKFMNSRNIINKTISNLRCHTKYKLPKERNSQHDRMCGDSSTTLTWEKGSPMGKCRIQIRHYKVNLMTAKGRIE